MQWLKDFINGFFRFLMDGFRWLAEALGEVLAYVAYTVYDGLLTVIFTFASAVDLSAVAFNIAAQYAGLPSQLIWLVNQVELPQSMTYIAAAIVIRMLLNLIPAAFTRI